MSQIRLATATDIPQLETLERATYPLEGYPAALFYQALGQWPQGLWVASAKTDPTIIHGYLLAALGAQDEHWIMSVLIASQARGQGLGKQLLQTYLAQLKSNHPSGVQVKLTVAPANTAAIALYRQLGFQKTDFLPNFMGPDEDRDLMVLQVS